jgi:hypothetical protein
MKARKLVLQATFLGMSANIATINVGNPAKERELREFTELVCPQDNKKTRYEVPHYRCDCGFSTTAWQGLKRVLKGTTTLLEIPKLTKGSEVEVAKIFTKPVEAFAKEALYTRGSERPVKAEDDNSILNLYRLMVAQAALNRVVIVKYNDTTEQVVALLTATENGDIVLREIIPTNLVIVGERLKLDKSKLTAKDIEEAKMFLKQIPEATAQDLEVTDYRVRQFEVAGVASGREEQKVAALGVIMEKAKARKEIIDKENKREVLVVAPSQQKKNQKKKKA